MFNKRTIEKKFPNLVFVGVLISVVLVTGAVSFIGQDSSYGVVYLAGNPIEVEVVRSLRDRTKGLSGRLLLAPDSGMLFVFDKPDRHGFWMKDMHFPIDIIWIDESFIVVDIKDNADPNSFPEAFFPSIPALYVLEVNASLAKRQDVIIGSEVSFESIIRD